MVKNKNLAIRLLIDKQTNALITYESISSRTGYSKRQLIRMYSTIQKEKDLSSLYLHGNVGKEPVNKASSSEIDFFITMKDKYPRITIAQFRDIFIEDILFNPDKKISSKNITYKIGVNHGSAIYLYLKTGNLQKPEKVFEEIIDQFIHYVNHQHKKEC